MTTTDTGPEAGDTRTEYRTCPLCEATCGLELTMRGDEVTRIRGDRNDVFSHGFICPKGSTLKPLHEDPDRLRAPLVRRGDDPATATWEEVSWDEAFAEVERLLTPILTEHGRDAAAIYLGNPSVHNFAATLYGRPLIQALGTKNIFSASTVDQMPRHVSCGLLYGDGLSIPVPDLDRTDHLILLGANPLESNGSLCTAPDFPGRLEAIRERGGRVVVIDPRRTRTAEAADEHHFIRPGTDALLLLAMAQVLLGDGPDSGPVAEFVTGLDELPALLAPFTPEAVADHTGIDADTTRRLARDLAAAPSGAVYGRIGTNTVAFGTLTSWATDVVTLLSGNLDRAGGLLWPTPAHEAPRPPGPGGRGFQLGRHFSRVKGYPEVRSEFPVATLADEIETPGEGQVRALVSVAGNPVLSTPDSDRLDAALATLDCYVAVDIYRNETTRHAHVILPPPSSLSRSHFDLAFYGLAVRNVANYSPPLVEPEGPSEREILARLALVAAGQGATADPGIIDELVLGALISRSTRAGTPLEGTDEADIRSALVAEDPADRALEVMLRAGPHGDRFGQDPEGLTLERLLDQPHGIDLGPLEPRLPDLLRTPSGTVELLAGPLREEIGRAAAVLDGAGPNGGMVLVGRRDLRSNNSWMHNIRVLVKGKPRCTLHLHPDDADRLGLAEGDQALVSSRVGEVVAPVQVTDAVMPGVVSLPHGWGHRTPGARGAVAAEHAGVNSNVLTDGAELDPLSGNAVLNGIPVEVTAV